MKPLISVVMAVYNTKRYLDKAIQSALNQTFEDFELVIVDDGSTDGSSEILQNYANQYPQKIRLFHQQNQGAFPAYNKCVELAEGQYIIPLNSDDYFTRDCLEIVSSYVLQHGVDVVFVNTATHVADMEQNIIRADFQSGIMQEEFIITEQKAVRQNWHKFMGLGLVRNNINLYKAEIMKRNPFRTDHYGADFMFNIDIANEIQSAACHPKDLYQNFLYVGNTDADRNISVGKYNDYEHDMFNKFYLRYKELFVSWNILDSERLRLLAGMRYSQLDTELSNINALNNSMTYYDNISHIISYFDDVLAETAAILGNRNDIESKILNACQAQISQAKNQRTRNKNREHCVAKLIDAAVLSERSAQERAPVIVNSLFDDNNPYRVGLSYMEQFCKQYPSAVDADILMYLQSEERARAYILTGKYDLAADEIDQLFNMPFSEPEKYLLLGLNCFHCGFAEDAINAIALGLERFPTYDRLIEANARFKEPRA